VYTHFVIKREYSYNIKIMSILKRINNKRYPEKGTLLAHPRVVQHRRFDKEFDKEESYTRFQKNQSSLKKT
jgi:hypothetical protein